MIMAPTVKISATIDLLDNGRCLKFTVVPQDLLILFRITDIDICFPTRARLKRALGVAKQLCRTLAAETAFTRILSIMRSS